MPVAGQTRRLRLFLRLLAALVPMLVLAAPGAVHALEGYEPVLQTGKKVMLDAITCKYPGEKCRQVELSTRVMDGPCRGESYNLLESGSQPAMDLYDWSRERRHRGKCHRIGVQLLPRHRAEEVSGLPTPEQAFGEWVSSGLVQPRGPLGIYRDGFVMATNVPHLYLAWGKLLLEPLPAGKDHLQDWQASLLYLSNDAMTGSLQRATEWGVDTVIDHWTRENQVPVIVAVLAAEKVAAARGRLAAVRGRELEIREHEAAARALALAEENRVLDSWAARGAVAFATPDRPTRQEIISWLKLTLSFEDSPMSPDDIAQCQAFTNIAKRHRWTLTPRCEKREPLPAHAAPAAKRHALIVEGWISNQRKLLAALEKNDLAALTELSRSGDEIIRPLAMRVAFAEQDDPAHWKRLADLGLFGTLWADIVVRQKGGTWIPVFPEAEAAVQRGLDDMKLVVIRSGHGCCGRLAGENRYARWRKWDIQTAFREEPFVAYHDDYDIEAWNETRNYAVSGPDPTVAWRFSREIGMLENRLIELSRVERNASAWSGVSSRAPAGVVSWDCDVNQRNCEAQWQGGGSYGSSNVGQGALNAVSGERGRIERRIAELQQQAEQATRDSKITWSENKRISIVRLKRTYRLDHPDAGPPEVLDYRREIDDPSASYARQKVFDESRDAVRNALARMTERVMEARIRQRLEKLAAQPGVTALDLDRERAWLRHLFLDEDLWGLADLGTTGFWYRIHYNRPAARGTGY